MFFKRQNENATKEEIKNHFNYFIQNISHHLEIAKQWLKKSKLDFSLEEIDEIERFYSELFKKNGKTPGSWYEENYEVYVTYIGEAFKKYFLGEWKINNIKKTFGYGYPFIFNMGAEEYVQNPIDPSSYLLAIENDAALEPLSGVFKRTINYYKNYPEWNFDPLENLKKNLENDN